MAHTTNLTHKHTLSLVQSFLNVTFPPSFRLDVFVPLVSMCGDEDDTASCLTHGFSESLVVQYVALLYGLLSQVPKVGSASIPGALVSCSSTGPLYLLFCLFRDWLLPGSSLHGILSLPGISHGQLHTRFSNHLNFCSIVEHNKNLVRAPEWSGEFVSFFKSFRWHVHNMQSLTLNSGPWAWWSWCFFFLYSALLTCFGASSHAKDSLFMTSDL